MRFPRPTADRRRRTLMTVREAAMVLQVKIPQVLELVSAGTICCAFDVRPQRRDSIDPEWIRIWAGEVFGSPHIHLMSISQVVDCVVGEYGEGHPTISTAANILAVDHFVIHVMVRLGLLTHRKDGKSHRINGSGLVDFLASRWLWAEPQARTIGHPTHA